MLILFVIVSLFLNLSCSVPQYYPTKPQWNWEEVILSRNGPSTSTTPRPKQWTTTTLRSFGDDPITGTGTGIIELTNIVHDPRRPKNAVRFGGSAEPQRSGANGVQMSMALIGVILTAVFY